MRETPGQELMRRKGAADLAIQMVLDGLASPHNKRAYARQLREFIDWFATTGQITISNVRKAAGLDDLRFHDGRHCALTVSGEKGVPEQTMLALFGDMGHAKALLAHSQTRT